MLNLRIMTSNYLIKGYSEQNANARVCQDIVLKAISLSKLSNNVTVKGGVVMRSITNNIRRATQDLDLDFIRYSLSDEAIKAFINELNCLEGISIEVIGQIEPLSQQEYNGKRIHIRISDSFENSVTSKLDLGVHKNMKIEQEEFCFDVCMDDDGAYLLMNTKEQIFSEKLRSLLRFGPFSTRYKDIFDLCYLSDNTDKEKLLECIKTYIFEDKETRENNIDDIILRVKKTFTNRKYSSSIKNSRKQSDWLGIGIDSAFLKILNYLETLK